MKSCFLEENDCFEIEQKTILHSNSSVWFNSRRNRITSSNAQKILIRNKNFQTLAGEFLKPEMKQKLPKVVKDALKANCMSLLLEEITPSILNLC